MEDDKNFGDGGILGFRLAFTGRGFAAVASQEKRNK
jgi:hypothetical protein